MYGEQHLLTYRTEEETKFVYFLSFRQFLWWLVGGILSMKLATYLPPVPYIGLWGYLPHGLPLLGAMLFAHIKHPSTDLMLGKYLSLWFAFHRRKKVYH
ncbi:PrgI family protein [Brevibacillus dissolubilis]|uniref:PrgI family protein n=1 Tax=Brevibacillus dissolubilis TaxID=1844116 RepID=UPI001115BFBB|nr:PrgI family protein [Brevibacillus dissolubilis]